MGCDEVVLFHLTCSFVGSNALIPQKMQKCRTRVRNFLEIEKMNSHAGMSIESIKHQNIAIFRCSHASNSVMESTH